MNQSWREEFEEVYFYLFEEEKVIMDGKECICVVAPTPIGRGLLDYISEVEQNARREVKDELLAEFDNLVDGKRSTAVILKESLNKLKNEKM